MTLRALQAGVSSSEREARRAVIESRRRPSGSAVAHLTLLRECPGDVIRIRRPLVVLQVTGHATGLGQVVVVIDVALRALQASMGPCKGKSSVVVTERGRRPARDGMTDLALLGEPSLHMVGI